MCVVQVCCIVCVIDCCVCFVLVGAFVVLICFVVDCSLCGVWLCVGCCVLCCKVM